MFSLDVCASPGVTWSTLTRRRTGLVGEGLWEGTALFASGASVAGPAGRAYPAGSRQQRQPRLLRLPCLPSPSPRAVQPLNTARAFRKSVIFPIFSDSNTKNRGTRFRGVRCAFSSVKKLHTQVSPILERECSHASSAGRITRNTPHARVHGYNKTRAKRVFSHLSYIC